MSGKAYVPPSMRRFANPSEEAPSSDAKPSRWTYTSRDSSGQEQALKNTSLASKQAPELAPTLIAPKSDFVRVNRRNGPSLASEEEFPTMGKKPVAATASAWGAKPSFAALSREWAAKQKEDEELAKKEAERAAMIERERRILQEKEDKERRAHQQLFHSGPSKKYGNVDDEKRYDIGGSYDDDIDDRMSSESEMYAEEEEEEDVVDDTWEHSRNKYDYY